jgi:hypothetical protein
MSILIAGEKSQVICIEFRKLGFEAYSNDLLPAEGGHPEWHIQADTRTLLKDYFDLVIFHPTCRYITNSGIRWLHTEEGRWEKMREACKFFNLRHKFNSPNVATENPRPHKYAVELIGKSTFHYQPWQHGEKQMKETHWWLKGDLKPLTPSDVVGPPPKDKKERLKWQDVWMASPGPEREALRSKTLKGPARAIAKQWSEAILKPVE